MTRVVSGSGYSETTIGVSPDMIFIFDGATLSASNATVLSASYARSASYAPTITTGLTATKSFTDSANSNAHVVHILMGRIITWDVTPF